MTPKQERAKTVHRDETINGKKFVGDTFERCILVSCELENCALRECRVMGGKMDAATWDNSLPTKRRGGGGL